MKKRQDKITSDRETAESDKAEALALKKEYEEKLKAADKEAESILSEARKVAMHNEQKIVDEAKQEAARIIERANAEIKRNDDLAAKEIVNERTKTMAEKEALVKAINVQRDTNDMSDVHVYDVLRGKWMVDDEAELHAPLRNIGTDAK